jgi:hypothetical protein
MKEMSLRRRLGVPYALIDYLLEFDRHNVKVVRTAFGDSEPFSSERGTCPLGGDDSPYAFLSVQGVKTQLTNKLTHNPYQYTTGIPNPTTSTDERGPSEEEEEARPQRHWSICYPSRKNTCL